MFGGPRAEGKPWPRPLQAPLDLEVKHPEANENIRSAIWDSSKVPPAQGSNSDREKGGAIWERLRSTSLILTSKFREITRPLYHLYPGVPYLVLYGYLNIYLLNELIQEFNFCFKVFII